MTLFVRDRHTWALGCDGYEAANAMGSTSWSLGASDVNIGADK